MKKQKLDMATLFALVVQDVRERAEANAAADGSEFEVSTFDSALIPPIKVAGRIVYPLGGR